jgi:hypothetical protein
MRSATLLTLALALPASASNVYVMSSGDPAIDNAVIAALTSRGHTCTLGVQFFNYTGQSLAAYQTVYLQANANWYLGEMSAAGGLALRTWVQNGGRLVTSEWVTYYSGTGDPFAPIASILPLNQSLQYGCETSTVYYQWTVDPQIMAGLPLGFGFPLDDYAGTEIYTGVKPGATLYYLIMNRAAAGLAGWTRGAGSVYSFSTTCGPTQLASETFSRLFSNVMGTVPPPPCYANCDGSTIPPVLNVADFNCFLASFANGDSYANCDQSTVPPILNVNDFTCFIAHFAAGCP